MAVVDRFAELLGEHGIPADPAALPPPDVISAALDRIDEWFWSLDAGVREGYDEATGEEALCRMLAEPEIDVASDVPGLLEAFDGSAGQTLSTMVATSRASLQRAIDEAGVG
jgi:hypothetical protein